MSVGAHPRSSPHLDAASHLGTAFSLLVPVEIFCLYSAHMCSIVKHLSRHIYTLDAVRRVLAWRQLLPPTNPGTPVAPCSLPSLPTISRPLCVATANLVSPIIGLGFGGYPRGQLPNLMSKG